MGDADEDRVSGQISKLFESGDLVLGVDLDKISS